MCRCDEQGPSDDDRDVIAQAEQEMQVEALKMRALRAGLDRVYAALDRAAMEREPGEDPDTRTPTERERDAATFAAAVAAVRRRRNPTPEERLLDALAFGAAVLIQRRLAGAALPESQQSLYIELFHARQQQRGRCLWPHEREILRLAAERMWCAMQDVAAARCGGLAA